MRLLKILEQAIFYSFYAIAEMRLKFFEFCCFALLINKIKLLNIIIQLKNFVIYDKFINSKIFF